MWIDGLATEATGLSPLLSVVINVTTLGFKDEAAISIDHGDDVDFYISALGIGEASVGD